MVAEKICGKISKVQGGFDFGAEPAGVVGVAEEGAAVDIYGLGNFFGCEVVGQVGKVVGEGEAKVELGWVNFNFANFGWTENGVNSFAVA